jgi:hypothetical protein
LGFLAALVVLFRPSSAAAFLTLSLIETVAIWRAVPQTNTNRFLQLFVFATLALTGIYVLARNRFSRLDTSRWLEQFQALLRLELVIVYALAGWHKLNAGYFDSQNSCAVILYQKIGPIPAGGDWLRWALIFGSIATELSLPVLLTFRRTRTFAVFYGLAFHVCLGIDGAYSFSVTMIALLFLFAPDAFFNAAADVWRHRRAFILATAALIGAAILGVTMLAKTRRGAGMSLVHLWVRELRQFDYWHDAGYWLFCFWCPLVVASFLWLWWRGRDTFLPTARCYTPISPVFWIVPALLVFDGLTPYLGLKTETAFAMYSNLRTEGEDTNHFIWRHRLDLADYQRDLVRIVDSNDPQLKNDAESDLPFPFYVMRKRISELARHGVKNVAVTYVRDGKTNVVDQAESVPDLAAMPSWIERKLLRFRWIQLVGCPH